MANSVSAQLCVVLLTAAVTLHYACAQVKISKFVPFEAPLYAMKSPVPRTWLEMRTQCNAEHPGYFILMKFKQLPSEVVELCPIGALVPIAVVVIDGVFTWDNVGDLQNKPISYEDGKTLNLSKVNEDVPYGALLWPTMKLNMVRDEALFTCAVCEMSQRMDIITKGVYPPLDSSIFSYDLELLSNDPVEDVSRVANGSDIANQLLENLAEAFNISTKSLRWHGAALNEDRRAVVHVYYDRGDTSPDWFDYERWYDQYVKHKAVDKFEMTLVKLNTECLADKRFLSNVRRDPYLTGALDVHLIDGSKATKVCHPEFPIIRIVATRECYWNAVNETALWSKWTTWCPDWAGTTDGPGLILSSIFALKGKEYKKALKNVDVMAVFSLEKQLAGVDTMFSLRVLVSLSNTLLLLHTRDLPHASVFDILSYSILTIIGKILMELKLDQKKTSELGRSSLMNVLVAESNSSDPVVGLALALSEDIQNPQIKVMQLNRSNMTLSSDTSHIVVTVSDSIAFSAKRLAIAFYAAHLDPPNQTRKYYDDSMEGWMSAIQVTFKRDKAYIGHLDTDFVDIAFKAVFHKTSLRGKCAERNFVTDEWFGGNCRILRSMRNKMLVCRCKNLHKEGDITTNVYLIYGFDASFSTYLANNLTLVIVVAVVCFMSALGLLSVVLTAILFPEWRADQGHKIFLQMTLALSLNLILGFINNFISIDTKTVACIAIGVLRHYSFLAMFFWMMVLSGLQVKRLMTIAGAKATTHLILKVSVIAWGLPLIPIVILLAWDTGFYKSEVSNRGYCYPEDIAFQATVQGPAGFILVANLVIFVIILNHIYGWVKCNKDFVIRKHTPGDRAEQPRKLCSSIFVFFLFGFTWTFHFLSEEGIINSEFLFEFMFLITASFHLFMLSFFFIVLDKKTRALWKKTLGCK